MSNKPVSFAVPLFLFVFTLVSLTGTHISAQEGLPDFEGIIEDVTPSEGTLGLLGRAIAVGDSVTIFETFDYQQIALAQVRTGSKASVWGKTDSLGHYIPAFISLTSHNRLIGPVSELTEDHFTIHGTDFYLADGYQCELGRLYRLPYPWNLIQLEDIIATSWMEREEGKTTRNIIAMLPQENLTAPVQLVDPEIPCVTAGGVTIRAVDWAHISDEDGGAIELSAFQPGDWIEVGIGEYYAPDSLIIENAVRLNAVQEWWSYGGVIRERDVTDNTLILLGRSLEVTPHTQFFDYMQNPITYDDLLEGDFVYCQVTPPEDSSLMLRSASRMTNFNATFEVKDLIQNIDYFDKTIRVGDFDVVYTDLTHFYLRDIGEISSSQLSPGINITVHGFTLEDRYEALSIEVEPNSSVANQVIERVDPTESVLIVSGHPVRILDNALIQITGEGEPQIISFEELEVGQKPHAQGYLLPPDTLVAFIVTIIEEPLSVDSYEGASPLLPRTATLLQNYPNPFNPMTTIEFIVPGTSSSSDEPVAGDQDAVDVSLMVYDIRGRLMRVLIDSPMAPGVHRTVGRGVNDRGGSVSSGAYLYRLISDGTHIQRKMLLIKVAAMDCGGLSIFRTR